MNYRALVLASVVALGSGSAFAGDGNEAIANRDSVRAVNSLNAVNVDVLQSRAAVATPAPAASVKAQRNAQPSYFDISERGKK